MDHLEILIDKLLIILPVDLPYLSILVQEPMGRYIIFGLVIVIGLSVAWLLFAALATLFRRDQRNHEASEPTVEIMGKPDNSSQGDLSDQDGFSFFKKDAESRTVESSEDPALLAIEQEMLAVRQLFTEGHLMREVYVAETRRLFEKAKKLRS